MEGPKGILIYENIVFVADEYLVGNRFVWLTKKKKGSCGCHRLSHETPFHFPLFHFTRNRHIPSSFRLV
ncbi:hypothetical protein RJT34_17771 [Clitoria ternatea]|uniref:Uncharacterized protein n=1 Tax=Clitoria ternatea TaxID=43366 RepID=A0AAN9PDL3_CLITE